MLDYHLRNFEFNFKIFNFKDIDNDFKEFDFQLKLFKCIMYTLLRLFLYSVHNIYFKTMIIFQKHQDSDQQFNFIKHMTTTIFSFYVLVPMNVLTSYGTFHPPYDVTDRTHQSKAGIHVKPTAPQILTISRIVVPFGHNAIWGHKNIFIFVHVS